MNEVKPFRGITYNNKRIKDFSKVLAPPYDVISKEQQDELYLKSSFNIIRLILGIELPDDNPYDNKYIRARQYMEQWTGSGVLNQEQVPCFYIYAQDYTVDNKSYTRWGFTGLYRLQPEKKGIIFPHEKTHSTPKKDRLSLIKEVNANLSPVFSLYSDIDGLTSYVKSMCQRWDPYIDTEIDGIRHRMWKLRDRVSVNNIAENMQTKQIFIADGHHRLEVAKQYQKLCRSKNPKSEDSPYDYVMMYFTSMEDEGLSILPTHRLIKLEQTSKTSFLKIKKFFDITQYNSIRPFKKATDKAKESDLIMLGMFDENTKKFYSLTLKEKALPDIKKIKTSKFIDRLDVSLLQEVILKRCLGVDPSSIKYTVSMKEAISRVKKKEFSIAFFLNPLKIQQLQDVVKAGELMPQKSTFFYPKLISGVTIHKF